MGGETHPFKDILTMFIKRDVSIRTVYVFTCGECFDRTNLLLEGDVQLTNEEMIVFLIDRGWVVPANLPDAYCSLCAHNGRQLPLLPLGNTGVTL